MDKKLNLCVKNSDRYCNENFNDIFLSDKLMFFLDFESEMPVYYIKIPFKDRDTFNCFKVSFTWHLDGKHIGINRKIRNAEEYKLERVLKNIQFINVEKIQKIDVNIDVTRYSRIVIPDDILSDIIETDLRENSQIICFNRCYYVKIHDIVLQYKILKTEEFVEEENVIYKVNNILSIKKSF